MRGFYLAFAAIFILSQPSTADAQRRLARRTVQPKRSWQQQRQRTPPRIEKRSPEVYARYFRRARNHLVNGGVRGFSKMNGFELKLGAGIGGVVGFFRGVEYEGGYFRNLRVTSLSVLGGAYVGTGGQESARLVWNKNGSPKVPRLELQASGGGGLFFGIEGSGSVGTGGARTRQFSHGLINGFFYGAGLRLNVPRAGARYKSEVLEGAERGLRRAQKQVQSGSRDTRELERLRRDYLHSYRWLTTGLRDNMEP